MSGTSVPILLTINQVAETLQVSPRTVRRWIDAGSLQHYKLGRQIRIAERDLRLFLGAREHVK